MPPKKQSAPATPAAQPVEETTKTGTAAVIPESEASAVAAPKKKGALATLADLGAMAMDDAEQDLGFKKGDVALPFFRILQSNSPQVKRQNAKFVEGAEAGMFYNTATNQIYPGMPPGIEVIPVHFTRQATLWIPRKQDQQQGPSGGGFVRELPLAEALELLKSCTKNDKKKDITPADYKSPQGENNGGLELVIAAMYYMMIVDRENRLFENVAYPLTSTQLKKSRAWNALIQNARVKGPQGLFRPAMFGMTYNLTTVPEQNTSGDWMGVKVVKGSPLLEYKDGQWAEGFPGAATFYQAAKELQALVQEGRVTAKGDYDDENTGAGGGDNEDDGPLPF